MMPDHVHTPVSIPPRHKVSAGIGLIKGKSAIWITQHCDGLARTFTAQSFCVGGRGYYINTVEREEKLIREYIGNQEEQV